jgi:hypothetical protein
MRKRYAELGKEFAENDAIDHSREQRRSRASPRPSQSARSSAVSVALSPICTPPINRFSADHTEHSRPFEWIADPDKIIAAVRRGHQVLASSR